MSGILKVDQIQLRDGSTPSAADLGLNIAGSVVQVINNLGTGGSGTSATAWTELQAFVTITPKFSNSILVVTFHATAYVDIDGSQGFFTITRDGTPIGLAASDGISQTICRGTSNYQPSSLQTKVVSGSTATTTFKIAARKSSGGSIYFPPGSVDQWSATVYEIAQ